MEDRKSTRLNSSHTEIYTLSLHDALPISAGEAGRFLLNGSRNRGRTTWKGPPFHFAADTTPNGRSEEHTSELQSHRDLHSFPTRRSSDLGGRGRAISSKR